MYPRKSTVRFQKRAGEKWPSNQTLFWKTWRWVNLWENIKYYGRLRRNLLQNVILCEKNSTNSVKRRDEVQKLMKDSTNSIIGQNLGQKLKSGSNRSFASKFNTKIPQIATFPCTFLYQMTYYSGEKNRIKYFLFPNIVSNSWPQIYKK